MKLSDLHDGPHMHRGDNPCHVLVNGVACGNNGDADLLVCGNCHFIDATLQGCESCGATAQDMAQWYPSRGS